MTLNELETIKLETIKLEQLTHDFFILALVVLVFFAYLFSLIKNPELRPWRRRPAQNLAKWLEIATGKLVPFAQARIRAEIEAHYAEAVKSHQDTGLSETNAQAVALADLGNAYAAARKYRREFLTDKESGLITKKLNLLRGNVPVNIWIQRFLFVIAIMLNVVDLFEPKTVQISRVLLLGSLLLTYFFWNKLHRRAREWASQKTTSAVLGWLIMLVGMEGLYSATLWASILYAPIYEGRLSGNLDNPAGVFTFIINTSVYAIVVIGQLVVVVQALRLRRKLQSADAGEIDLPPQNPSVA